MLHRIQEMLAQKQIRTVYLKTPVPVHIEYWTAWVERDGRLNFRKDIY